VFEGIRPDSGVINQPVAEDFVVLPSRITLLLMVPE